MLANWLKGDSGEKAAGEGEAKANGGGEQSRSDKAAAARKAALEADPELAPELSPEEAERQRTMEIRKKLREAAREGQQMNPNNMVSYDSLFRTVARVLMDGQGAAQEMHDGLQINVARQGQMAMVSSKWQLGDPQSAHWECSVAMSGFNDMVNVTYNTLGRWSLMYQRFFRSGALGVLQFMAQPQMMAMGAPGTLFAMLQYPWVNGGCTQVQYVRTQSVSLSHTQRLIRGVHAGAQLTFEPMTNATSMSYAVGTQSADRTAHFAAEYKDNGEWKIGATKQTWETDSEFGVQLEYSEGKQGFSSALSFGIKKHLIGGGVVNATVQGLRRVKATLELPFGGNRQGVNQVKLNYGVQYSIGNGGFKHGVTLSL